jgi:hypothetical protein
LRVCDDLFLRDDPAVRIIRGHCVQSSEMPVKSFPFFFTAPL